MLSMDGPGQVVTESDTGLFREQVRIVPLLSYDNLQMVALGGREQYLKESLLTAYLEDGDEAAQEEIFMCK